MQKIKHMIAEHKIKTLISNALVAHSRIEHFETTRTYGYLEALLMVAGEIEDDNFPFMTIKKSKNILGKVTERKETYNEFIFRKSVEYLAK